ncbi:hypothetical protein K388_05049 [Streptomyces sp. KhCrAH-43]|uniref:hypothetical protein n=1 Tax=unclassified Streptomyces TaxID=2593676 RepID=UPI000372F348|nr:MULTISPECIES: hypothetical protein [unclassified Streptomyces]MYX67315.1 hypothetical protein [Streptomyces sp. SID8373]RAJ54915.1 hypothetical protein K388_05049 [Streptomyces sp. KhCrAH-43]
MKTFTLAWGDRPIQLETDGARTFLRLGATLRVEVTDASLDQLDKLADVAADLADMRRDRDRAAEVADQVAAEDGVRSISIPAQPGRVAA